MGYITLQNNIGCKATFSTLGARWVGLEIPDGEGTLWDPILGFDTEEAYLNASEKYHGAVVGRVCGRIRGAGFRLNNHHYTLTENDGFGSPRKNHLHGGVEGFHLKQWSCLRSTTPSGDEQLIFGYISPSGEEGYPGELTVAVVYTLLKDQSTVEMSCSATTTQSTIVNLTQHAFFNLDGARCGTPMLNHQLTIPSSLLFECDRQFLPTGRMLPVDGSVLDFRCPRTIAESIVGDHSQIIDGRGYSVAYLLDNASDEPMHLAALLHSPDSGRTLTILTDRPSLQVYTACFMDGSDLGKHHTPYVQSAGIALETQDYPDAPSHPHFSSIELHPGESYQHNTKYIFK